MARTNPIEVEVVILDNDIHRRVDTATQIVNGVVWCSFIIVNHAALVAAQLNRKPVQFYVPVSYWRNGQIVAFPQN